MNIKLFIKNRQNRINQVLEEFLKNLDCPEKTLHEAILYSVLSNGKRLRPLLVYLSGEMFGVDKKELDILACAVEFMHTSSLIHDDLPCMDDDDIRRGKPSCHKAFGENVALLAGDALLLLSLEVIGQKSKLASDRIVQIIHTITKATGASGLLSGQVLDTTTPIKNLTESNFLNIYQLKTGKLFKTCVMLGAFAAGIKNQSILSKLEAFAIAFGLGFQIQDDILEMLELDTEKHAKKLKQKPNSELPSYAELFGLDKARKTMKFFYSQANHVLDHIDYDTRLLCEFTQFVENR